MSRAAAFVLVAAACLLPLTAPRPAAAAFPPAFPRLANMYWLTFVDSTVIDALSKWDVVVLNSIWTNEQLAQLREKNPDIRIYFYVIAYTTEVPPAGGDAWKVENYNYALAHDLWWYDKNAAPASDWPNTRMCNITEFAPPGPLGTWNQYFASRIEELVTTHPDLDGIFFDNFWEEVSWQQAARQLDSDCNPSSNPGGCDGVADTNAELDASWNAALRAIATDIRARFDVLQASRPRPLAILTNNATDYFENLNGAMVEYFPSAHSNVDYDNAYGYNWNEEMLNAPGGYLTAPFRDVPYRVQVLNGDWWGSLWAPADGTDYQRHKRFTLGSTLLGDGYFSMDAGQVFGHGNLWWQPEFDHDGRGKGYLGMPLGPPVRLLQPTGPEILVNGDFSAGTGGWLGFPFGGTGSFSLDTSEFHSAPASGRIDLTSTGPAGNGYYKLWQDPVPLVQHTSYTLRFWAKSDHPSTKLELHFYSDNCPNLRCWGDRRFWVGTEWTPIEMSFSSTGTASSGMNLFVRSEGSLWVDDLSLRTGDTSLFRRDFENGVVLLNYTRQNQTVDLGGTFWRLKVAGYQYAGLYDGSPLTSEVVPFSDARIVLRDSTPDAPPDSTHPSDVAPSAGASLTLHQNEPNPFNPDTEIRFSTATDGIAELAVFDVAGRRVRTLLRGPVPGGVTYRVRWNGEDDKGRRLGSGVYFYRLRSGPDAVTRKMILVR